MEKYSIGKLKNLLYSIVQDNLQQKSRADEIKTKIDLLEGLITDLDGTNYERIYSNIWIMDTFLPILYDEKKAKKLSDRIILLLNSLIKCEKNTKRVLKEDVLKFKSAYTCLLNELKDDLDRLKIQYKLALEKYKEDEIITYRRIISKLKFKDYIDTKELEIIEQIMDKYEINEKEQIRVFENLKIHNQDIALQRTGTKSRIMDRHMILNMINGLYEKYDAPYITDSDTRKRVDSVLNTYLTIINDKDINIDEVISSLPNLKDRQYSFEEFDAIFINILMSIQEQLMLDVNYISKKEFFKDLKFQEDIKVEYNTTMNKYLKLRNYYYKEKDEYEQNILSKQELKPKNNIFFAKKKNGETYLENDLDDIPNEYLYKINILLTKFQADQLSVSEMKILKEDVKLKKMFELRDDQIRITFFHVNNNNYIITGCGVKKQKNDRVFYSNMAGRNRNIKLDTPEEISKNTKESKMINKRIKDYIEKNKRKGIR